MGSSLRGSSEIAVIGGGPAGLRAAEMAARGGARVTLFEAKASVGRKFLVAGRGGLNLTHAEPLARFASRYAGPPEWWSAALAEFDPAALRAWAEGLGVPTFAASTGRVYPVALKAAPLLRRWVARLRELGVMLAMHHRWVGLRRGARWEVEFAVGEERRAVEADAVILALGGGSWPQTGSDGAWVNPLAALGVEIAPLQPANCGWETPWPLEFLAVAEGQPLKTIAARVGEVSVRGELLITRYGLEGGALYQLAPLLRQMPAPALHLDLKPEQTAAQLVAKLGANPRHFLAEARLRWRLSKAAFALLAEHARAVKSAPALATLAKAVPIAFTGPRPLAEAISSAGGVAWSGLTEGLMLRNQPGVFVAGEMIDWEAPTGGYLLQGAFTTAERAARAALHFLSPECAR